MERRNALSKHRGFTLVELLVAMAVVIILMAGVYQFFISQQRSFSTQDEVSRMQQEARMCIELLSRTIQQTGAYQPQVAPPGGANIGGFTISLRGQTLESASDRYLTLQYDDPFRPLD